MSISADKSNRPVQKRPFRTAVLRGLGIVMPPILTVVIFVWVGKTLHQYVMQPVTAGTTNVLARYLDDSKATLDDPHPTQDPGMFLDQNGVVYAKMDDGRYVPYEVWDEVRRSSGRDSMPTTTRGLYRRWVQIRYLQPYVVVPVFTILFVIAMYLLGRFLAAGIGRVLWNLFERGVQRLPLVRNVYGSVKQVTDFMFSESETQFTRIVAIEYPRKGIWSLAFVTSESIEELRDAAGEPVLACLVPTSPMPFAGFTVTVKQREAIDLNLSMDQALQFIISCGVVTPPPQLLEDARQSGSLEGSQTTPSRKALSA